MITLDTYSTIFILEINDFYSKSYNPNKLFTFVKNNH